MTSGFISTTGSFIYFIRNFLKFFLFSCVALILSLFSIKFFFFYSSIGGNSSKTKYFFGLVQTVDLRFIKVKLWLRVSHVSLSFIGRHYNNMINTAAFCECRKWKSMHTMTYFSVTVASLPFFCYYVWRLVGFAPCNVTKHAQRGLCLLLHREVCEVCVVLDSAHRLRCARPS